LQQSLCEQRSGIPDAEIDPLSVPEIRQLADWLHSEWLLGKKSQLDAKWDGTEAASLLR